MRSVICNMFGALQRHETTSPNQHEVLAQKRPGGTNGTVNDQSPIDGEAPLKLSSASIKAGVVTSATFCFVQGRWGSPISEPDVIRTAEIDLTS